MQKAARSGCIIPNNRESTRGHDVREAEILSTFPALEPQGALAARERERVFDACQVGVVLRAVLFVQIVMAVAAMFGAVSPLDWLVRMALFTGAALPATLLWLVAACFLKAPLARLSERLGSLAGIVLGAFAGMAGCGLLMLAAIEQNPPWIAAAAAGAALAGALVMALRLRAKGRDPAEAAARLAELQARIRPHFLFNTLNSAIALVRAEPARAEALLEDLSDLFRHALADSGDAVSLQQELALARRYLEIEQVRFGARLQLEWALDPRADAARLPPLLLQPLVENAVRHGVEPSQQGALIRISTQRRGSVAVIKVTNTVPAGAGRPGHGLALDNVRDRLQLLHDVQGRFQSGMADGVFQVRIEVPL